MIRKVLVGFVLVCLMLGIIPIPVATEENTYKPMSLHFPDSSELKIYPQIGTLRNAMVTEISSNEYKYGFEDYNDYDWNDVVIRVKILEEDTDPVVFRVYLDEVNTMGVRELQIFLEATSEVAQVKLEYDDGTINTYEMPSEGLTLSLYQNLYGEGRRPDCYADVSVYKTEETTPTPTEATGLRIEAHIKQIEPGSLTSGDVEIPYESVIIETDEIHGTADCKKNLWYLYTQTGKNCTI